MYVLLWSAIWAAFKTMETGDTFGRTVSDESLIDTHLNIKINSFRRNIVTTYNTLRIRERQGKRWSRISDLTSKKTAGIAALDFN